jgi:hypothetical protein
VARSGLLNRNFVGSFALRIRFSIGCENNRRQRFGLYSKTRSRLSTSKSAGVPRARIKTTGFSCAILTPSSEENFKALGNKYVINLNAVAYFQIAPDGAVASSMGSPFRPCLPAPAGTDSLLDNVATALHLNLRAQAKFGLEHKSRIGSWRSAV